MRGRGSIDDRWWRVLPDGTRVKTSRHGTRAKRYLVRWYDEDGSQRSRAAASRPEAEAMLADVSVAKRSGRYVTPAAGAATVAEYVAVWLPRQVHLREASRDKVAERLRAHVLPAIGAVRLRDLTRADVEDLVADLSAVRAPRTVKAVHATVQAVLAAAVREKRVQENAATGVRLPSVPPTPVTPLTAAQVRALHDAMPARLRAALLLAAASGLRLSEVCGLTWDRVDLDAPSVRVDRQLTAAAARTPTWCPPKSRASVRTVRIDEGTAAALAAHRDAHGEGPGGLVFTNLRGQVLNQRSAARAWHAAARDAGLAGLPALTGWHALRHYHASVLVAAGVSVRYVADRLGHASATLTLSTYSHLMPHEDDRAAAIAAASIAPTPPRHLTAVAS